jgi:HSP20 family protein
MPQRRIKIFHVLFKHCQRDCPYATARVPIGMEVALKRDDYTVEIFDERLVVRGEQKQSSEQDGHADDTERGYGAFMRILPLPRAVDAEHAHAHYKNGVLRVTLPKTARAETRRVKLQVRG